MNPIKLFYFGDLMAKLLIGQEQLRVPPNVKDVGALMRLLANRGGDWKAAFGEYRQTLRITVNKIDADAGSPIQGGDEVAFIESVSI